MAKFTEKEKQTLKTMVVSKLAGLKKVLTENEDKYKQPMIPLGYKVELEVIIGKQKEEYRYYENILKKI